MVIHNNSDEKIIYFALQHFERKGNLDGFSHQLLRAFDHI